ncbi:hypothetical protein D3875_08655 [Deinococcus cavernae]|uniref:Uncharacterized protein n=1 Tax=Deinococcus cavernae TaxID=2320857 RepID=A0A418VC90_9DEIO|nr:hypothetical protein [Deinococcus cavernae]RJF73622.1 hypothetical protein D3875_08655 [Deinococcus cavernae]
MRNVLFRQLAKKGKLGKLLVMAPIALEVANLMRQTQKAKQGKYAKARKRDKAFDFALDQANRLIGKKKPAKRRWF